VLFTPSGASSTSIPSATVGRPAQAGVCGNTASRPTIAKVITTNANLAYIFAPDLRLATSRRLVLEKGDIPDAGLL
jgi:hypothetical protein